MNTGAFHGSEESFKILKDWTCEVLNIDALKREGRNAGKHQSKANFFKLASHASFIHSLWIQQTICTLQVISKSNYRSSNWKISGFCAISVICI